MSQPTLLALVLLGPLRAAWFPIGPFGGPASLVVADPHCLKTFVAGTGNALLFQTTDGGDSWVPLPFPPQLQAELHALAIDPQVRGVWLAGLSGAQQPFSGMLRSTDSGSTWTPVADLKGIAVRAIAFRRLRSVEVFAGTDEGVFVSQDRGLHWKRFSPQQNQQLKPVVSLALDPGDRDVVYAGTPHLPWVTSNGGALWRPIPAGMLDDSDIFSLQVDRNRPQRLFAAACSGMYRTLSSGMLWTGLKGPGGGAPRSYVVAQDPLYENIWYSGTADGLLVSRDGGNTWTKRVSQPVHSIAFDPNRLGRMLIAADIEGILRSDDGGKTWVTANRGFCNRQADSVAVAGGAVYTTMIDSSGREETFWAAAERPAWRRVGSAPDSALSPLVSMDPERWLLATPAGLKVSRDWGASWEVLGLGSDSIQAICVHPQHPETLFAARFGAIYRSTDGGRKWNSISPAGWPATSIKQLAILPEFPGRLLVLTRQQGIWVLEIDR